MPNLAEIRVEINRIDAALKPLLKERMDQAEQVAAAKRESAAKSGEIPVIFVGPREEEILAAVDAGKHTEAVRILMKEIMGVSRRRQYQMLSASGVLTDRFGSYQPNTPCILPLAEGKLTAALQIVTRYAVTVVAADSENLTLIAEDAKEMQVLRTQLAAEGLLKD